MPFEHYIYSGTKRLRCGFTTGVCAALAASAALRALLGNTTVTRARLVTPSGIAVETAVRLVESSRDSTCYGVVKDAGDDVDVTDGIEIRARVSLRRETGVRIDGGVGVGRVTKPGLDQPVGAAAINSAPRKLIEQEINRVAADFGYKGGVSIVIEVPEGARLADKTFNPRLGIVGGISILGTSGIVEPQSLDALADTIELEIHTLRAQGLQRLVLVPGNYGESYSRSLAIPEQVPLVKCSNFIGHAIDCAVCEGMDQILLVGHLGKLVKVAAGIMDTHSRVADARCEIFAAHAAACGASQACILKLFDCATSDACVDVLIAEGIDKEVFARIGEALQEHLDIRAAGQASVGAVAFSLPHNKGIHTSRAADIFSCWLAQKG